MLQNALDRFHSYQLTRYKAHKMGELMTIGARAGAYPGIPVKPMFQVVVVNDDHGAGPEVTTPVDRVVDCVGSPKTVDPQR